jgi:hypothetical protein
MFDRIDALIAAVIAGLLGWAVATALITFLVRAILYPRYLTHLGLFELLLAIPCGITMLPSWLFVSLFAYAHLRREAPDN